VSLIGVSFWWYYVSLACRSSGAQIGAQRVFGVISVPFPGHSPAKQEEFSREAIVGCRRWGRRIQEDTRPEEGGPTIEKTETASQLESGIIRRYPVISVQCEKGRFTLGKIRLSCLFVFTRLLSLFGRLSQQSMTSVCHGAKVFSNPCGERNRQARRAQHPSPLEFHRDAEEDDGRSIRARWLLSSTQRPPAQPPRLVFYGPCFFASFRSCLRSFLIAGASISATILSNPDCRSSSS